MKIQTNKIAPCKQEIKVDIPVDKLEQKMDNLYSQISRTAQISGFRKGKVPRNILEAHYREEIKDKAIGETVTEAYSDAAKNFDFVPIDLPQISNVKLENDYLRFQATVETRPEVKLGRYKGIKLVKKEGKVNKDDVEQQLKFLQQIRQTSQQKNSAEKKQDDLPPLDDEFAQQMGKSSLKELKEAIREDLIQVRKEETDRKLESDLFEQILKSSNFDLPDSLVQKQKKTLLENMQNYLAQQGVEQEKIDSHLKESKKTAQDRAVKELKILFILDKIARQEKIEIGEQELNKEVEGIAQRFKKGVDEIKEDIAKKGLIDDLKVKLRERKTVEFLIKESQVNETTI
ncbi:MAG: hypothetical protein KAS87_05720 [Candidatus Omnitrophica bacterium]|nr:hypothetical protein [Candidatus Omnitrophota bacterium]